MATEAQPDVVGADPAFRRKALALALGVVVVILVVVLSAPRFLVSLSALSRASPGEAVVWFAAFIVPVLVLAFAVGVAALRRSLATLREGRFPPPGMRMVRETPVIRGRPARVLGILGCALGTTLLAAALLLGWMSYRVGAVLWYGCPRATRPA
jgi:hypothetical protein